MEKNYEQRLNRYHLTEAQKEKYAGIYNRMHAARTQAKEDLNKMAQRISFAGFVKGKKKLALTDNEIRKGNAALCLVPVEVSTNLMNVRSLADARPAPQLRSLGLITVYEPAAVDEKPHLSALDVLAQIPAEFADQVSAFCLRLEDKFELNGYNLVAQAYEYKVELFAQ